MKEPSGSVLTDAVAAGIAVPNKFPYTDISVAMVLWNEAHRLPRLLDVLQPRFDRIVIVVQDSTDDTLKIAKARARAGDIVERDEWRGTGDASMPLLTSLVRTDWTLVIAGDEMPDEELLDHLWAAGWWAEQNDIDGLWIPFRSTIEGVGYEEQHGHLRMFRSNLHWPETMHSRPTPRDEGWWPYGHIDHDRSLDEFIRDYLRYLSMSGENEGWLAHNQMMLRTSCEGVAAVKGWDYVKAYPWWPEVERAVF